MEEELEGKGRQCKSARELLSCRGLSRWGIDNYLPVDWKF